jgi:hypothetical protein
MEFDEQRQDGVPYIPAAPIDGELPIGSEDVDTAASDGAAEEIETDCIGSDPELVVEVAEPNSKDKQGETVPDAAGAVAMAASTESTAALEDAPVDSDSDGTSTQSAATAQSAESVEEGSTAISSTTPPTVHAYVTIEPNRPDDTAAAAEVATPAVTEDRGTLVASLMGGAVEIRSVGNDKYAVEFNAKTTTLTDDGVTQHIVEARMVMDTAGNVFESTEAPAEPSVLDYRQPFDETYTPPSEADQQAAGNMLRDIHDAVVASFPASPSLLPDMDITNVRMNDMVVSATSVPPEQATGTWMNAEKRVYIGEQVPSGTGQYAEYCLDTNGAATRFDAQGPNNTTMRQDLIDSLRLKAARSAGPAQAVKIAAEIQDRISLLADRRMAATRGVNNLPVSPAEMRAFARVVGEKLGITDRLQHLLDGPEEK